MFMKKLIFLMAIFLVLSGCAHTQLLNINRSSSTLETYNRLVAGKKALIKLNDNKIIKSSNLHFFKQYMTFVSDKTGHSLRLEYFRIKK